MMAENSEEIARKVEFWNSEYKTAPTQKRQESCRAIRNFMEKKYHDLTGQWYEVKKE